MKSAFPLWLYLILLLAGPANAYAQTGSEREHSPNSSKEEIDQKLEHIDQVLSYSADSALELLNPLIEGWVHQDNDYAEGRAKSLKAWILIFQSRYEESLKLGHEAWRVQKKTGTDSTGIALTLNRIGLANLQFERFDDAKKYISEALEYFRVLRDTSGIDMALNNLGAVALYKDDWKKAIDYLKQTIELWRLQGDYSEMAYAFYNVGHVYFSRDILDSARIYFTKSIDAFEVVDEMNVPVLLLLSMAELHKQDEDLKSAYRYAQRALKKAEERGHTESVLSAKGLIAEIHASRENFKEAYQMHLEYGQLKDRLDSANSSARVAEIEERYKNAEKEVEISRLQAQNLRVENEAQESRLLALYSILGALILLSGFLFFFLRRRQQQKVRESLLQARVAESKLIALRAQMNPHFIFNCINTAQNFVLGSDKGTAYEYLANFARLLRMVLENSNKTYIPFQEEVEQLQLYIELEKVRFDDRFEYSLEIDPELEGGVYEVPGMIVQPLVENAILHGLVNREGPDGHLHLKFHKAEDHIRCQVRDNGVGRKRAREIKAGKKKHYQSAALPNVRERLETLQQSDGEVKITDLHLNGQPAGTEAEVHLPFR